MYILISFTQATLWSFLTPLVFIGSIYIKKPSNSARDHPNEIKRRFFVVGSATGLWNFFFYYYYSDPYLSPQGPDVLEWIGLNLTFTNYISVLCSLAITFVLYAGSLAQILFDDLPVINFDVRAMRAYVMAPIFEEAMFRSCLINCLISGGYGWHSVWVSSLIFGLSHLYRLENIISEKRDFTFNNVFPVLFQVFFTTLFGLYVGYVFVVTGSLYAVIVLHGFCNFMGLPNMKFLDPDQFAYKYKTGIAIVYIGGIVGFFVLNYLMMNPDFFNSLHSRLIKQLVN
jgi:prenyl protein peptidase